MKSTPCWLFAALALLALPGTAWAQAGVGWYVPDYTYYPNYYGYGPTVVPNSGYLTPYGFVPGVRAYGSGWYPGNGLYPGYSGLGTGLYGQARLAEGLGQYNRDTADAERQLAEARQVDAATRAQQVQAYWDARRQREDFVRAQRSQRRNRPQPAVPLAPAASGRRGVRRQDGRHPVAPFAERGRLCDYPRRGRAALRRAAEDRQGRRGTLNYLEIRTAIGKVRDVLEANVGKVPADDWIAANQFLNRLTNEAREAPAARQP